MDASEIILVLLTSSVVAAAVSVLLNWAQNRSLERYKAEIRLTTFQSETRFAKLHERRAEALAELYRRLAQAKEAVKTDGVPPHPAATEDMEEEEKAEREISRLRSGIDALSRVRDYYQENRLFFSQDQCEMMDEILFFVEAAWISIQDTRLLGEQEDQPLKGLRHGNTLLHQRVDPLMDNLDSSFKDVLGFTLSDQR